MLRLVWATDEPPAAGFDSEVVLHLRPDIDGAALLGGFADEAVDLLLELPALETITIGDRTLRRTARDLDGGLTEITVGENTWWQYVTDTRAGWFRWSTAASAPSPRTCCARPPGPTRNCRCPRC